MDPSDELMFLALGGGNEVGEAEVRIASGRAALDERGPARARDQLAGRKQCQDQLRCSIQGHQQAATDHSDRMRSTSRQGKGVGDEDFECDNE